ncbi:site-2 protease family protein [Planctomycetes bacterium K23_9]|uniref:Peptidase family M50 n=1 Tax=Stieleria marina TaxID=1930275 RepID=A0A517NX20_9BACT|nr:Peptidase family M50 [Planctomycetes bacterium K23_9]
MGTHALVGGVLNVFDQPSDSGGSGLPPSGSQGPPPDPNLLIAVDSDVTFSTRDYGGRTSYVAHHGKLGQYFRLGVEEYHVAVHFDGRRSLGEIHEQISNDGVQWSVEDVARFASELVKQKIASAHQAATEPKPDETDSGSADSDVNGNGAIDPAAPPNKPSRLQKAMQLLSLTVSQRFPLMDGHVIAQKCDRVVGPAFSRVGRLVWIVLVGSGMLVVLKHHDEFAIEIRRLFDPGIWVFLLLFWCLAKVLHEIGHAVCAYRNGVRIGKTGVMFFLLAPLAYVDVTDAWKLPKRLQRVQIALAGVYLELAVASIAAWAWWLLPIGTPRHFAAQIFLVAGPATLLVNANPLLRLDGYYVLSDLLEIPNLRMHGRAQLGQRIEWVLFGLPVGTPRMFGWRRPAATFHAICSVVFQFFWMSGLVVAVAMWARGLGIVLACFALLLWAILPLGRWIYKIWTLQPGQGFGLNLYRRRLIGYSLIIVTVLQHVSFSSSPFDRRVSVVVRFQDEQVARASADAFVTAVHVQRGDRVKSGMLLVELSQPELIVQRDQKADDILLAQQRAVQFRRRGELSRTAAEMENAESLQRQLVELNEQIAGLRVTAIRDGVITSTDPRRLLGNYAKRGQELVRVSDPREKELLAVVGREDMATYQAAVKSSSLSSVRLRGGQTFYASPAMLLPRAIEALPHPALAASVGGPVAVEPSTNPDREMQMIQPHAQSETPLDAVTSLMVHSGQVGTMTISDDRSLLTRIYDDMVASATPQ